MCRIHDLPGWTQGHLDAHAAAMAQIVSEFIDARLGPPAAARLGAADPAAARGDIAQ